MSREDAARAGGRAGRDGRGGGGGPHRVAQAHAGDHGHHHGHGGQGHHQPVARLAGAGPGAGRTGAAAATRGTGRRRRSAGTPRRLGRRGPDARRGESARRGPPGAGGRCGGDLAGRGAMAVGSDPDGAVPGYGPARSHRGAAHRGQGDGPPVAGWPGPAVGRHRGAVTASAPAGGVVCSGPVVGSEVSLICFHLPIQRRMRGRSASGPVNLTTPLEVSGLRTPSTPQYEDRKFTGHAGDGQAWPARGPTRDRARRTAGPGPRDPPRRGSTPRRAPSGPVGRTMSDMSERVDPAPEGAPLGQGLGGDGELAQGQPGSQPEAQQGGHAGVELHEPAGEGVVPVDQGRLDAADGTRGGHRRWPGPTPRSTTSSWASARGPRRWPPRPPGRARRRSATGPRATRHRVSARSRAMAAWVYSNSVAAVVGGDGDQDVGLVVGLVVPDPPDDGGVGQPEAGLLLHPVEDPFEGEGLGAGPQALLLQDGAPGVEQEDPELLFGSVCAGERAAISPTLGAGRPGLPGSSPSYRPLPPEPQNPQSAQNPQRTL